MKELKRTIRKNVYDQINTSESQKIVMYCDSIVRK